MDEDEYIHCFKKIEYLCVFGAVDFGPDFVLVLGP